VIGGFIASLGFDCDLITRGGAVQDLVRPEDGFDKSLLRDIRVSVELHQAGTIYLINHDDCGAYRALAFDSKDAELAWHSDDLDKAAEILEGHFPGVRVVKMLALLEPDSDDKYVIGLGQ